MSLVLSPDHEQQLLPMSQQEQRQQLTIWSLALPLALFHDSHINYAFKLVEGEQQWWLHGSGVSNTPPSCDQLFRYNSRSTPPSWVQDQIFYQIFPDRFHNSQARDAMGYEPYGHRLGSHRPTFREWGELPSDDHGGKASAELFGGIWQGLKRSYPTCSL